MTMPSQHDSAEPRTAEAWRLRLQGCLATGRNTHSRPGPRHYDPDSIGVTCSLSNFIGPLCTHTLMESHSTFYPDASMQRKLYHLNDIAYGFQYTIVDDNSEQEPKHGQGSEQPAAWPSGRHSRHACNPHLKAAAARHLQYDSVCMRQYDAHACLQRIPKHR
eukprot:jgi/Ulvmu1/6227/UM028_0085.1